MKYYILDASFVDEHPLGETLQTAIREHLKYLEAGIKSGQILFSGPKVGSEGGVIVMKCQDYDEVQHFCDNDPIVIAGIQQYNSIEFKPHTCQKKVESWFE